MKSPILNARVVRRMALALGCALSLGACTGWMETSNPSPYSARVVRGPLRIVRTDGFAIVAEDVSVRNDSVVGHEAGHDDHLIAVALADIRVTQTQEVEPAKSLGMIALTAAAAFGGYVYLLLSAGD